MKIPGVFFSVKAVAQQLDVCTKTVRDWSKKLGILPIAFQTDYSRPTHKWTQGQIDRIREAKGRKTNGL